MSSLDWTSGGPLPTTSARTVHSPVSRAGFCDMLSSPGPALSKKHRTGQGPSFPAVGGFVAAAAARRSASGRKFCRQAPQGSRQRLGRALSRGLASGRDRRSPALHNFQVANLATAPLLSIPSVITGRVSGLRAGVAAPGTQPYAVGAPVVGSGVRLGSTDPSVASSMPLGAGPLQAPPKPCPAFPRLLAVWARG